MEQLLHEKGRANRKPQNPDPIWNLSNSEPPNQIYLTVDMLVCIRAAV
jgi:hypothetical protein